MAWNGKFRAKASAVKNLLLKACLFAAFSKVLALFTRGKQGIWAKTHAMKKLLFVPLALGLVGSALAQPPARVTPRYVAQIEEAEKPELALGLAESLLLQGKYMEAVKLAERALKANPDNERALFIIAKASISLGRLEVAQTYVDDLLKMDPNHPDYHALQGMIAMFSDHPERAYQSLTEALELGKARQVSDSYMASYANTLVLAYHRFGRSQEALRVCREFLTNYPHDPDLYVSASRLYREAHDYQKALEMAQKGIEERPDFPNLYASLALAEQGLGHTEESEAAYRKLLILDPNLAEVLRATLDGAAQDKAEYKVKVE